MLRKLRILEAILLLIYLMPTYFSPVLGEMMKNNNEVYGNVVADSMNKPQYGVLSNTTVGSVKEDPSSQQEFYATVLYIGAIRSTTSDTIFTNTWETVYIGAPNAPKGYEFSYMTACSVSGVDDSKFPDPEKYVFIYPYVSMLLYTSSTIRAEVYASSSYLLEIFRDIKASCVAFYKRAEYVKIVDGKMELDVWPPPQNLGFDYWSIVVVLDSFTPLKIDRIINPNGEDVTIFNPYSRNPPVLCPTSRIAIFSSDYLIGGPYGKYEIYFTIDEALPLSASIYTQMAEYQIPPLSNITIEAQIPENGIFQSMEVITDGEAFISGENKSLKTGLYGIIMDKNLNTYRYVYTPFEKKIVVRNEASQNIKVIVYSTSLIPLSVEYKEDGIYFKKQEKGGLILGSPILPLNPHILIEFHTLLFPLTSYPAGQPFYTVTSFQSSSGSYNMEALVFSPIPFDAEFVPVYYIYDILGYSLCEIGPDSSEEGDYRAIVEWNKFDVQVKYEDGTYGGGLDIEFLKRDGGELKLLEKSQTASDGRASFTAYPIESGIIRVSKAGRILKEVSIDMSTIAKIIRESSYLPIVVPKLPVLVNVTTLEEVPFGRTFQIDVKVTNLGNDKVDLKIVLNEHAGFQAGDFYGDGDEIMPLSLGGGESKVVSFKAKVFGTPRSSEQIIIRTYEEEKLVDEKKLDVAINPEVADIVAVIRPSWVEVGDEFEVGVLFSYSFTYPTVINGTLTSEGRVLGVSNVEVQGKGTELLSFRVSKEFTSKTGSRRLAVNLMVYYPEENSIVEYPYKGAVTCEREFVVDVGTKNAYEPKSNLYPTEVRYRIALDGKEYVAVLMYNKGEEGRPVGNTSESAIRHAYSLMNWLVFDGNGKIVTDDELYKQLAWIAEIAHLRRLMWTPARLNDLSKEYAELATLAGTAEATLIAQRIILNTIMAVRGKVLQSWVAEKLLDFSDIAGITVTSTSSETILEYLRAIKFADNLLEAVEKSGGSVEEALTWLSIIYLREAADNLTRINKLLIDVDSQPVDGLEALEFMNALKYYVTMGNFGRRVLSARYADEWRSVKEGIMTIIPLSTVPEVYEKLKDLLGLKSVATYFSYLVNEYSHFELCERILKEESIKFRDTFLSELDDAILVKLTEAPGQHKLLLKVYDKNGKVVGFNNEKGLVEVNIPGAYYFDLGESIIVLMPYGVEINRIIVDASQAKMPQENYNLSITVIRGGRPEAEAVQSYQISQGKSTEFTVKISEEKGTVTVQMEVISQNYFPYLIAGSVVAVIAMTIAVVLLRSRRKYKGQPVMQGNL